MFSVTSRNFLVYCSPMKLHINKDEFIETNEAFDLSIPLSDTEDNPRAWYVDKPVFSPVMTEQYTGSVKKGGNVNFRNIFFNPHGHGTHTECLGHITEEVYSINQTLKEYFFKAQLMTVSPTLMGNEDNDEVILAKQIEDIGIGVEALIIRTLPNFKNKKSKKYSAKNPPYFDLKCVDLIITKGIKHLLIDLPSVDRENDNGALVFHHAFWEVPENPNFERTITEMIFVEDKIEDGIYLLNIQTAPFENDATPSRPILYKIQKD